MKLVNIHPIINKISSITIIFCFRYKAKKKYDEAEYLLYESVLTLLRHEQVTVLCYSMFFLKVISSTKR